METRIKNIDSDIQEIYQYQIDPKYAQDKITELENRSHRNNLRIDGIKGKTEKRGMTTKKKFRICLHINWDWMILNFISVHNE